MKTKKLPKANLERKRGMYFQMGLVIALSAALLAFEWMTFEEFEKEKSETSYTETLETENMPITRMPEKPKPKKQVRKPKISHTLPPETIQTEPEDNKDPDIPEPPEWDDQYDLEEPGGTFDPFFNKIFISVENMPHACNCREIKNKEQQALCTDREIQKHFASNVKYPYDAKQIGIDGTVYVNFVVDKTGKVSQAKILKGVYPSLDKEALRLVKTLPCYIPGKQRGLPVNVSFNAPIKFTLY
ncbi:MAG: hypothetical protein COA57_05660 [Flavobacteriales bacterium]|nr:MAG: hypothetical protein COA57_05660 [Flavobacteriales bacterium]